MAEQFGADPTTAASLTTVLRQIRAELSDRRALVDGAAAASGSARVTQALTEFGERSSQAREALDQLLERAAGLLDALTTGVAAVDHDLTGSLGPTRPGA